MACEHIQVLQKLIDKTDTFEAVRDKIAVILSTEFDNQKIKASQCSKDSTDFNVKVYTERTNSIEELLSENDQPVINVWFDSEDFDKSVGDVVKTQRASGRFFIDIHAVGYSENNPGDGHIAGDEQAARNSHKTARYCRNILMASHNAYLQMRGIVGQRWIDSISSYQQKTENSALQIVSTRITMSVSFNEFSPQYEGELLEQINVDIVRAEDGAVLSQLQIDLTE